MLSLMGFLMYFYLWSLRAVIANSMHSMSSLVGANSSDLMSFCCGLLSTMSILRVRWKNPRYGVTHILAKNIIRHISVVTENVLILRNSQWLKFRSLSLLSSVTDEMLSLCFPTLSVHHIKHLPCQLDLTAQGWTGCSKHDPSYTHKSTHKHTHRCNTHTHMHTRAHTHIRKKKNSETLWQLEQQEHAYAATLIPVIQPCEDILTTTCLSQVKVRVWTTLR